MNIWLLHPYAGGPGLGRHWRPYWLADAWNKLGNRSTVVTASYHHQLLGPPRQPGYARIGDVDFWFVRTPAYRGNGLGRLTNMVWFGPRFAFDAEEVAQACGPADLIIASTPHLFYVPFANRVAKKIRAKFWVEVRDLWPKSIVELGIAPSWNPLVMLLSATERYAYRAAGRVVSLLNGAEGHMLSRGLAPGRFLWIPNGVSESEIANAVLDRPLPDCGLLEQIRKLRAKGKKVVVYAGAMGPPNGLELLIQAAAGLAQSDHDIHILLVGTGISAPKLREQAQGLHNVEFWSEVERPVAQAALRASDCAVIVLRESALYDNGISLNKLFDYCLFAPRSVIACDERALSGLETLVTRRCDPGNAKLLAHTLSSVLQETGRPPQQRASLVRAFSYSDLANRYIA